MPTKIIPELNFLLSEVEKHYGRKIATSTDFESLSVIIEKETRELISSSTLKRLFGSVTSKPVPRKSTLDILSRFVGKRSFEEFRNGLKDSPAYNSSFFSAKAIYASELEKGARLRVGWAPDRVVILEYLSGGEFRVVESINSQLRENDRFELAGLMLGYPLFISRILRDGEYTNSYIAGSRDGLNLLELVK